MARDLPELPEGWDQGVPPSAWPEALIAAIRTSVRALASQKAQTTLIEWQAIAKGPTSVAQIEARRRLIEVGAALLPPEKGIDTDLLLDQILPPARTSSLRVGEDTYTVDAFQMPPRPNLRRSPGSQSAPVARAPSAMPADDAIVAEDKVDTDSKVKRIEIRFDGSGASAAPAFTDDDDRPTYAFARPKIEEASKTPSVRPPPPPPRSESDSDGLPTRHIAIPDDLLKRPNSRSADPTMMLTPPASLQKELEDEDATYALSADEAPKRPGALGEPDGESSGRLAPKAGVIQRRSTRNRQTSARPRASMQHVRPLYVLLKPFATELLPLSVERRSRRFWARWRELAGDRGVRRERVEELLSTAHDARTLVCGLIAEVELADRKSVHALYDKLEESGGVEAARAQVQATPAERFSGPLVGAPVALDEDLE